MRVLPWTEVAHTPPHTPTHTQIQTPTHTGSVAAVNAAVFQPRLQSYLRFRRPDLTKH